MKPENFYNKDYRELAKFSARILAGSALVFGASQIESDSSSSEIDIDSASMAQQGVYQDYEDYLKRYSSLLIDALEDDTAESAVRGDDVHPGKDIQFMTAGRNHYLQLERIEEEVLPVERVLSEPVEQVEEVFPPPPPAEVATTQQSPAESVPIQPTALSPDWPTSMEPCGGDLPPCYVKERESGGDYSAENPTGCSGRTCGGAWQFDPQTWGNYGGYYFAQDAPPALQDQRAREVWDNGNGCAHWAACGH